MPRIWFLLMCVVLLGGDFLPQQLPHFPSGRARPNGVESMIACWVASGEQPSAEYGYALSSGDVNGDGFADVLVGVPKYGEEVARSGAVFAYYGGPGGLKSTPDWQFTGPQAGARFGGAVSVGDVNGDGYEDVIVGAFRYNGGLTEEGAVFGFWGGSTGLGNVPAWVMEGEQVAGQFGYAVSGGGDVNGDGFADVLIGARGQNFFAGAVYIYHGTADGLETTPAWAVAGTQSGANLGFSVSHAGDVNGDGFGDVVLGAPFMDLDETAQDSGAAFVHLGSAAGLALEAAWSFAGGQAGDRLGMAVAGAGDVNGDGFAEGLIGAPGQDGEWEDEGAALLFSGSEEGWSAEPVWVGTSGQSGSEYGVAVGGAGDINSDGFADIAVGAHMFQDDQAAEGAVFIYLGASGGLSTVASRPTGNKAETWFGYAVGMAKDINGDGLDEVLVGAPEYRIDHDLVGRAYVFEMQTSGNFSVYLPAISFNLEVSQ